MKRLPGWTILSLAVSAIILPVVLVSSLPLDASATVDAEGWKRVDDEVVIKQATLIHLTTTIHSLWIKVAPSKTSSQFLASQQILKKMNRDPEQLHYIGYLSEMDCMQGKHRVISTIYYRKDKNIIASRHNDYSPWESTDNFGVFHDVYQTVCEDKIRESMAYAHGSCD